MVCCADGYLKTIMIFFSYYQNPTEAVRKVARFLNKDLSEETVNSIAEKCSFKNLKAANDSLKKRPEQLAERVRLLQEKGGKIPSGPPNLYRKGMQQLIKSLRIRL